MAQETPAGDGTDGSSAEPGDKPGPTLKVKLASALLKFRPEDTTDNPFEVPLPAGGCAADLIAALNIPASQRLMVIINSNLVPVDQLKSFRLNEADKVSLVPPIQAG